MQISETTLTNALQKADLNALRLALFQATGDPRYAEMEVVRTPFRGAYLCGVAERHRDDLIASAAEFLRSATAERVLPEASREDARRLMQVYSGEEWDGPEFDMAWEELALEDYPHDVTWTSGRPAEADNVKVVVIGAGISGLAMGVLLTRLGIPYEILERQAGLGGTWHLNQYPDARVDAGSYLYQYRFEKAYPWPSYHATQAEAKRYLEHIADKHGVADHIRYGIEVTGATWDEDERHWTIEHRTSDGSVTSEQANVVVSCSGLFSTPKIPEIAGVESFRGAVVHTTQWNQTSVAGKRVALIGNGSSGVQITPYLAEHSQSLTVFQRTPQWLTPVGDYRDEVPAETQWLFENMPYYWNWYTYGLFFASVGVQPTQEYDQAWQQAGGTVNEANDALRDTLTAYIRDQLDGDEPLIKRVLPSYAPLGRRLVVDSGWYQAIRRDDVELVTDGIEEFTPDGIRSKDGTEREFDVVVLATGFSVSKYFYPAGYQGRDGATFDDLWSKDGARSYWGIAYPGFPNFYSFYGPNGQTRGGGFFFWSGVWSRYVGTVLVDMIERGWQSVELTQDAFEEYNERLDEATRQIVWEGEGQGGYYVNEHGRSGVNMPWRTDHYHRQMRRPTYGDYTVRR